MAAEQNQWPGISQSRPRRNAMHFTSRGTMLEAKFEVDVWEGSDSEDVEASDEGDA